MGDVAVDVVGVVVHLPQLVREGRHLVAEAAVHGLGAGQVVARRAHPADARDDPGQLLDGAADHEPLEAPQLGNLEVAVLDRAPVVEEDLDLPVPLEPGDGIDADSPAHGPNLLSQEGRREPEPVGQAHQVGDVVEDPLDLLRILAVDDRAEGRDDLGPLVLHVGQWTVAAAAGHAAVGAAHAAAAPRGRSGAGDPLLQQALLRLLDDLPGPVELLHHLLGLVASALVADGPVGGADHGVPRRQVSRGDGEQHRLHLGRGRRAARNVVVDLHDPIELVDARIEPGDLQVVPPGLAVGPGNRDVAGLDRRVVQVGRRQDLLEPDQVGEARNPAQVGAGAERHQELALAAQQPGHLLVLGVADGAVEDGQVQLLVGHGLDVAVLPVRGDGPEPDVGQGGHVQEELVGVEDRDVAAPAGGTPVERDLQLSLAP